MPPPKICIKIVSIFRKYNFKVSWTIKICYEHIHVSPQGNVLIKKIPYLILNNEVIMCGLVNRRSLVRIPFIANFYFIFFLENILIVQYVLLRISTILNWWLEDNNSRLKKVSDYFTFTITLVMFTSDLAIASCLTLPYYIRLIY